MSNVDKDLYEFSDFRLDVAEHLLLKKGERVALPEKAFEILCLLIRQSGHLVGKDELLEEAWAGAFVEENNLDKNISYLRHALGERKGKQKFIETVRGRGYRFVAEVRRIEDLGIGTTADLGFENGNRNGDERRATDDELITKDEKSNPKSQIRNPKSNVVALAQWRREIGDENQTDGTSAFEAAPEAIAVEPQPTVETAPTAKERIGATSTPAKQKSGVRRLALLATISIVALAGIGFAFYKFVNPAPIQFEAKKTTRLTSSGRVKVAAVSPDGKFIIYSQEENNEQQSLWMRHIGSESNVQIVAPANSEYRGLSISPDGNSFYYTNEKGTLYQMPVLGGTAKKIADGLFASSLSTNIGISPDGKQIAFVRHVGKDRALYIANADGTNESKLYSFEQPIHLNPFPAWSPDGKVIACPFMRDGEHNILAVQVADGTSALIFPQNWIRVSQITWMPDSKSMLVSGVKNGLLELRELWQISYPSGEARPITNDTIKYSHISLTSDGHSLMADRIEHSAQIWTMPTDDVGRARQLTTGFEKLDGTLGLDWTPDGKIVYGTVLSGKLSIWMMEADGDNPKQVVNGSSGSAVSPDGQYVVYQKRTSEDNIGLWRTDLSNREEKQLTKGVDHHWTFSPDGKWIVFTRWGERVALWKVAIEGGEQTQIFDKGVTNSAVAPDGKTIAVTYGFTSGKITLIPFGGGEIIKAFDAKFEVSPQTTKRKLQWTSDGRGIYFIAFTNGVSNIWRQPIDGSPSVQVTDFKDGRIFNFAFSPDGSQLALSRGTFNSDVVLIENQK